MSSLIHTTIMGTPATRSLGATAPTLYMLALGIGFALTSLYANHPMPGLMVTGVAAVLLWRSQRKAQAQLERLAETRTASASWHAFMAGSPDGIMLLVRRHDLLGCFMGWEIREANGRAHDLFSEDHRGLVDQSLLHALPAYMHGRIRPMLEMAHKSGLPYRGEHALDEPGSSEAGARWVQHQVIPCDAGIMLITREMTEMHTTAQRQGSEQLQMASRVIDETGDAIVVSDALDRIEMVNPAFLAMTGLSPSEVIGKSAELVGLTPLRNSHLQGITEALLAGRSWSGESRQLCADTNVIDTWLSVSTLRNNNQRVTQHVRVFSDISPLKARQLELVEQARHDSLTGLPNRRAFEERLAQAMARAQRQPQTLAVLFLDLDGFKAVNDSLGHAAGDEVLTEVARRLMDAVRLTDCVCRLGGDEFTVILEGAGHPGEVRRICQRILQRLSQPHELSAASMTVTPSIGTAVYEDGESPEELCARADSAMYTAKHAGKARFVISMAERSGESANAVHW